MEESCLELGSNRAENECPKHYSSATWTVSAPNMDLWRSDILSNCCELFPVARHSYDTNASDEIWIGLRMGL